jgi:hypothetical protein
LERELRGESEADRNEEIPDQYRDLAELYDQDDVEVPFNDEDDRR